MNNNIISIFLLLSCSAHAMKSHTPVLYIHNKTNTAVTVQVTNPIAHKTVSQLLNPQKGMFAYEVKTIEAIMINGNIPVGFQNLQQGTVYQQLITQAQHTEKNLCIDILQLQPLQLSFAYLCSKTVSIDRASNPPETAPLAHPRVLIKNNNWFWGNFTEITLFDTSSQPLKTTWSTLRPQEIKQLQNITTIQQYRITMRGPSGITREFYITEELLKGIHDAHMDLLYEFTSDWLGTIQLKKEFLIREQTDKILHQSQQPSRVAQIWRNIANLRNQVAYRLFGKYYQTINPNTP